jgi:hypothetical protein
VVEAASYPNAGTLRRERMKFESNFTQLPNVWLRDKRLSFAARGLLAHLMTHEVGYQISLAGLSRETWKEGRDGLRLCVTELEKNGYLQRVKERSRGRFQGYGWYLRDPFEIPEPAQPELPIGSVDNPPTVVGLDHNGEIQRRRQTVAGKTTTIEDQVKNTSSTSVSNALLDAPVDNFGAVVWSDERCAGNWRDGKHELNQHGMCKHCQERPSVRNVS